LLLKCDIVISYEFIEIFWQRSEEGGATVKHLVFAMPVAVAAPAVAVAAPAVVDVFRKALDRMEWSPPTRVSNIAN
jgi:hypothetical protein